MLSCHAMLCMAGVPHVALMPSGDAKASAIVDLMEVALAQRDDLVLLDRANVGRILGEQKLVLEGLLSADDAFAIGQLLGCDVFGELHFQSGGDGGSAFGVLTAFDAGTGVRLCDATLDASGSLQAISEAAGEILLEALQKRADAVSRTNVRAVTLLSVRNVDLPLAQSHLPEVVGTTLERQLLRSAGITVLERKHLNQVNQEAVLIGDIRDRLLASSVLVDLDLSRGTTTGSLSIRGVAGNNGDEWVEALMSSPSIPHELTFASSYESRTGQKKESRAKDQLYYGFDIRDLSPTGLRRLMDYYVGWRKKVDGGGGDVLGK